MFKDVGGEIKGWAVISIGLITICGAIFGGLLGWSTGRGDLEGEVIFGALIGGVIGYFVGRLSAMALYAFGQLVECVESINKILYNKSTIIRPQEKAGNQESGSVGQKPPPIVISELWFCRTCGERNEGGGLICKKCNTPK